MKSEMLNSLKEYFKNTPREEVVKEWERIKGLNFESPNAFLYLDYLKELYCFSEIPNSYFFNGNKEYDSNFLESFFLFSIAV